MHRRSSFRPALIARLSDAAPSAARRPGAILRVAMLALHLSTACALLAGAAWAPPASAQSPAQAQRYDIPAGPLTATLNAFAERAGIFLSAPAEMTQGKSSAGLSGHYSVEQAFQELLRGQSLVAVRQASGAYLLRRAPTSAADAADATLLSAVEVTASPERETATGPVRGYAAKRSATGAKSDLTLSETPQAVNVVTRDEMDARNALTLSDALNYTPGVQASWSGYELRQDVILLRGFNANYAVFQDGLRSLTGEYVIPRLDPWGAERVEVLKGPASMLYGANAPGGLVNYVSKRPTWESRHEASLQFGSHGYKQAAIDIGGPLGDDEQFAYRLAASARDSDAEVRHTRDKRQFIAPSLTWQPSANTTLTLLAQYQKDKVHGWTGYFWPIDGTLRPNPNGQLDPRTFPGEPDLDHWNVERSNIGFELEHRFNDTWSVSQVVRYTHIDFKAANSFLSGWADASKRLINRGYVGWNESVSGLQADQRLQARFSTGPVQHVAIGGIDLRRLHSDYRFDMGALDPLDLYAPVYGAQAQGIFTDTQTRSRTRQTGVYLQDQLKWNDWALMLGARYDQASLNRSGFDWSGNVDQQTKDSVWTGRIGLTYQIAHGLSTYASWSSSFDPASGTTKEGDYFKPTKGKQMEVGVKYQPADSPVSASLAVFDLTQTNVTTTDPADVNFNRQLGEVRVRGIELEGKLQLDRQWGLIASYAHLDATVTRSTPDASGANIEGNRLINTPRDQFALWADYAGVQALAGLRIGVGVRYRSGTFGDDFNRIRLPSLTMWDARLSYDLGAASSALRGLTVALSATNLFNKQYVASCYSDTACYWGSGRLVYGSVNYRW